MQRIYDGLKEGLSSLRLSFTHLVYPSFCLQCEELLPPEHANFCRGCAECLERILPSERCPFCFLPKSSATLCPRCRVFPLFFHGVASVFDYQGPAAMLIKKLKYGNLPLLASGMASFLVLQWLELNWPTPDIVVPVPQFFLRTLQRGYNQSELLAQEFSKQLQIPTRNVLKRNFGGFRQANLNLEQRQKLHTDSFSMRRGMDISNKTILMIDDVLTSGATLKQCGVVLKKGGATQLYALTFCRT